ncbi:hypothetical protein OKW21_003867 [Catalinimonas alkaloidigena]|uniref:hypothetical protein n=1 Tax=Catalinimonas alkaloidigena TaxID=1075417 RepID=UPI0024052034|nr:hypothetical protein [Catalinimonas alkaloidigena]MDF9798604.1 hypothetical protein [Catalinimonas alkaloidigena]
MKNTTLTPTPKTQKNQEEEKDVLINKLIKQPEIYSKQDTKKLLGVVNDDLFGAEELVNVIDLKLAILRIFDQNENYKFDNASSGYLGRLNNLSQNRRNNKFIKKIKKNPMAMRVVAEGDSWFEHPISDDVIDWIDHLGDKDIAIYSLARGGDFLTNILEEREYITELSIISPDAFLVSAGGIELVNHRRVSLMVNAEGGYVTEEYKQQHPLIRKVLDDDTLSSDTKAQIERGLHFLNREYFSLIAILELKYKYMIKQLRKKFPDLRMICHGYDYPIPSFRRGSWIKPIGRLMRIIGDNGRHFKQPMLIKRIIKQQDQNDIAFAMLHLFNEMLYDLVNDPAFGREVFMIDCRGYAKPVDWFDELHLEPKKIEKVAEAFLQCMNSTEPQQKVFQVRLPAML